MLPLQVGNPRPDKDQPIGPLAVLTDKWPIY
jgi:hypothetical protein